ncbi:hypothetical protein [Shewanella sp.]|uniref:hypothetical protein n=1 Tax=Shewanella sp. TaxID=50422 RepID=UPI003A975167
MDQLLIQVNLDDKVSLQHALTAFQAQLQAAYQQGELIGNVGGFIRHDNKPFIRTDLLDRRQYEAMLFINNSNFVPEPPEELTEEDKAYVLENGVFLRLSHMVVFQQALTHDDLKPLLVEICEQLVAFCIQVNSSNELFFTSDILFGNYLLVLLAEKYPEYAYLLGEYYPHDAYFDQIAYHGCDLILYLFEKYGYSDLMLDVLASCRFRYLLSCITSNYNEGYERVPRLLYCFLRQPERWQYYQRAVLASFKRRPMPLANDALAGHKYHPLGWLDSDFEYLCDQRMEPEEAGYAECCQWLTEEQAEEREFGDFMLHGHSIEAISESLEEAIFSAIQDVPLVQLYYYDAPILNDTLTLADIVNNPFYQPYDPDDDNEYETNRSFLLECFDNGKKIINYIEDNRDADVLDELQPTNLRQLAFEHQHFIYKRFDYFGSGDMQLSSDLRHDISLDDIAERFLVVYQNPDIYDLEDEGEYENDQKCLRLLDVLVRLFGKKELNADELAIIVDDFELCSMQQAVRRFTLAQFSANETRDILYELINEPLQSTFGLRKLDEIYRFYQKDKSLLPEMLPTIIERAYYDTPADIRGVVPALNQQEFARGSQLLAVAYILAQEDDGLFANSQLAPLWHFYYQELYKRCYHEMALEAGKDGESPLLDTIKQYVAGQAAASGGLLARFKAKSAPASSGVSKADALAAAQQLLAYDRVDDDDEQNRDEMRTHLLESDAMGMALASMVYAAKVAKGPQKKQLLSLFELLLTLFPSKTLLLCFQEFSADGEHFAAASAAEVEAFCDWLADIKIDEKYQYLARIQVVHQANKYEDDWQEFDDDHGLQTLYGPLLKRYRAKDNVDDELPAMLARREQKITGALVEAVALLNHQHRTRFLSFI